MVDINIRVCIFVWIYAWQMLLWWNKMNRFLVVFPIYLHASIFIWIYAFDISAHKNIRNKWFHLHSILPRSLCARLHTFWNDTIIAYTRNIPLGKYIPIHEEKTWSAPRCEKNARDGTRDVDLCIVADMWRDNACRIFYSIGPFFFHAAWKLAWLAVLRALYT